VTSARRASSAVSVGQARLFYEASGDGDPVVLIHAGVADSRQWNNEFDFLSSTHRAIRYDMRGYGRSEPVDEEYSHLADLLAILNSLNILGPAVLIGCSMGGQLAIDLALEHPSRVRALILAGSSPSGFDADLADSALWIAAERAWKAREIDQTAELETQIWFDGRGRTPQQVDQAMRRLAFEMDRQALTHEARNLGMRLPNAALPAVDRLSQIRSPVLLITGANDQPSIHRAAEYMLTQLPVCRRAVIQDAAHLANMDHPAVFRGLVKDFLQEVSAGASGADDHTPSPGAS